MKMNREEKAKVAKYASENGVVKALHRTHATMCTLETTPT